MRIVNVNKRDTGNQSYKLSKAINEIFPNEHESRAFITSQGYTGFPYDVIKRPEWKGNKWPNWIIDYWRSADIIHRHGFWKWGEGWPKHRESTGKILHQHGRFGSHITPKMVSEEDKRYGQFRVVSTVNLLAWVSNDPERWFPPPIDIERIDKIKRDYRVERDNITVMHSPTDRGRKHTELFIRTMREIRKKYPHVQVLLVEGKTNQECLQIRASADICFDQLLLQYGTSGLEAMTMGQPVIAGCNDRTWSIIGDIVGVPPFIRTSPRTLFKNIERLIVDDSLRKYMGAIGRNYIERYHSFDSTAKLAIKTYKRVIS